MVFSNVLYEPCGSVFPASSGAGGKEEPVIDSSPSWNSTTAVIRSHRLLAPWEKQPTRTRNKAVREVVDWTSAGCNQDGIVRDPSFIDKLEQGDGSGEESINSEQPFHYRLAMQYKRRALERSRQQNVVDNKSSHPDKSTSAGEEAGEEVGLRTAEAEKEVQENASEKAKESATEKENKVGEGHVKKSDSGLGAGRRKKRLTFPLFASVRSPETKVSAPAEEAATKKTTSGDEDNFEETMKIEEAAIANMDELKKTQDEEDKKTDETKPLKKKEKDNGGGRRKKRMAFARFASLRTVDSRANMPNAEDLTATLPTKTSSISEDELLSLEVSSVEEQGMKDVDGHSPSSPTSTAGYLLGSSELEEKTLSLLEEMGMSPTSVGEDDKGNKGKRNSIEKLPPSTQDRNLVIPALEGPPTEMGTLELEEKTQSVLDEISCIIDQQHQPTYADVSLVPIEDDQAADSNGYELDEKTQSLLEEIGWMMDQQQCEPDPSVGLATAELDPKSDTRQLKKTRSSLEEVEPMNEESEKPPLVAVERGVVEKARSSDGLEIELDREEESLRVDFGSMNGQPQMEPSGVAVDHGVVKEALSSDGLEIELGREQEAKLLKSAVDGAAPTVKG